MIQFFICLTFGLLISAQEHKASNTDVEVAESPISGFEMLEGWRKNIKTHIKGRENLVQLPMRDLYGSQGLCGSFHYNPQLYYNDEVRGNPKKTTRAGITDVHVVDNFLEPNAACSIVGVMQEWKKTFCPDPKNKGCRFSYGDCAHKDESANAKGYWEHATHKGKCIDIRPLRTGEFVDRAISYVDEGIYDRPTTIELLKLLKKHNGHGLTEKEPPLFTDPVMNESKDTKELARKAKGHANHIHVCFYEKDACKNLEYYKSVCDF